MYLYFANPPEQTKAEMTIDDWERPASTFRFDWARHVDHVGHVVCPNRDVRRPVNTTRGSSRIVVVKVRDLYIEGARRVLGDLLEGS